MTENSDDIDLAFQRFEAISDKIHYIDKTKWSEADTRLKVIDEIVFDVLGWDKLEAKVEDRVEIGFTDYTLKIGQANKLIVEAKKDIIDFGLGTRESGQAYKLNGSVFNTASSEAILQVFNYSSLKGTELAVATNGREWIVFRTNRLADGVEPLQGKGFIFSSPAKIKEHFRVFYDLLSRHSSESLKFRGEFQRVEGAPIRDLSFLKPIRSPESKKMQKRGDFAADFDSLMTSFFERLKGDRDSEMIEQCFVVTKESELAEEKLTRVASDLVEKIRNIDTSTGQALVDVIQSAKLQQQHRFILLVGNKGAGKTTFVDRFFRFVLPKNISSEIVLLRVDLALNTGDEKSLVEWINKKLLKECEATVFTDNMKWEDLIGKMFFDEYQRWSNGSMKHMYENDKESFKVEFGKHIEEIRRTDPHDYIKRIINFITKSNHKVPCLVFDNTDHFTIPFQEAVFQYARSVYEDEFCVVILPITDKTSWQLSKQGAFQSFESEVLHLPVPAPQKVIEKRIEYLIEKLRISNESDRNQYFLERGIRLSLQHIEGFVRGLNKLFIETGDASKWIGGLSNFDIRRLLELCKDIISSPYLKLDDLVKAHIAGNVEPIPRHRIKNAIIKKRYDIYPSNEHSFVQNIFAIHTDPATSPLLGLRILQYLRDIGKNDKHEQIQFVKVSDISDYFSNIGVPTGITKKWINELLRLGLLLNYDPTVLTIVEDTQVEISPSGITHLNWGSADSEYFRAMSLVTPIRVAKVHQEIQNAYSDYKNKWAESVICFIDYLIAEDAIYCRIPEHESFKGQQDLTVRFNWLSQRTKSQYRPQRGPRVQ